MSSTAWVFQKGEHVEKMGRDKAPWYCGWYDPDGHRRKKSFGEGFQGQKKAERFRSKIENELMAGTYQMNVKKLWPEFRQEYRERILEGLAPLTRRAAETSLDHFERIIKPVRMLALLTCHIDDFIAARRKEPGAKPGSLLSPASTNKDLRHIKAALAVAVEWGYLTKVPKFRMEKEPKKLPTYVPPDDFALLYQACDHARRPLDLPYPAAEWWRALLITAYMTGWRIGQLLALKREDVDLDKGLALSEAGDNKGKRDAYIPLHPIVVEHMRRIPSLSPVFFPWTHGDRQLYDELEAIQQKAKLRPSVGKRGHYTFHDLRPRFATMNADKLTPDALQALMQHKDYQTTQKYINMARQLTPAVEGLFVPNLTPKAKNA